MNLTEKIAYIRGLCEGLNLDESKPEVKVMNAIIDLLDDMSYSVTDMEDLYDELSAQVDATRILQRLKLSFTAKMMTLIMMTMKMTKKTKTMFFMK